VRTRVEPCAERGGAGRASPIVMLMDWCTSVASLLSTSCSTDMTVMESDLNTACACTDKRTQAGRQERRVSCALGAVLTARADALHVGSAACVRVPRDTSRRALCRRTSSGSTELHRRSRP
jgi:hypothetical protein